MAKPHPPAFPSPEPEIQRGRKRRRSPPSLPLRGDRPDPVGGVQHLPRPAETALDLRHQPVVAEYLEEPPGWLVLAIQEAPAAGLAGRTPTEPEPVSIPVAQHPRRTQAAEAEDEKSQPESQGLGLRRAGPAVPAATRDRRRWERDQGRGTELRGVALRDFSMDSGFLQHKLQKGLQKNGILYSL